MKAVCLKEQLHKALTLAERHTARTPQVPILQGAIITAKNNNLVIQSTNLETGFEITIPSKIQTEGNVVIPVKTVASFLTTLHSDKVNLESKNSNLYITTDNTSTLFKGYPSDEFPRMPTIKNTDIISFSCDKLSDSLKSVIIAASLSEVKPEIASVYFNIKDARNAKVVATDSFRLAERKIEIDVQKSLSFLVPQRYIVELIRTLEQFDGDIDVSLDGHHIAFVHPSFKYIARLTEGVFPNYEQIIPSSFSTDVSLEKKLLIEALKMGGVLSDRLNEVTLHIHPEDGVFEVLTRNADTGEHSSRIPATITGDRLEMAFNYRYLLDGLEHFSSSKVLLRFNGESKPVLVQAHDDISYLYLVMPMKGTS